MRVDVETRRAMFRLGFHVRAVVIIDCVRRTHTHTHTHNDRRNPPVEWSHPAHDCGLYTRARVLRAFEGHWYTRRQHPHIIHIILDAVQKGYI